MELQGLATFNGVQALCSAIFTLNHGTSPSTCTIYCPPQTSAPAQVGTLQFTFGGTAITFPDCFLKKIVTETGNDGRQYWVLTILDHRWRWNLARISGEYNIRTDDQEIRAGTAKKPRELLKLLFDGMGETNVDLSRVPNEEFPHKFWEYARNDQEISTIADALGCRVVMQPGNRVVVLPSSTGANLPIDDLVTEGQLALEAPEMPTELVYVAGRTLYQIDFELEAVMEDVDGQLKLMNDVSYKPTTPGGWDYFDPNHANTIKTIEARELAKRWAFRGYRIKTPFTIFGEKIDSLDRILPITSRQVATRINRGRVENWPAVIYGQYHPGWSASKNNDAIVKPDTKGNPKQVWWRGFTIDEERGCVLFSEPVYVYQAAPAAAGFGSLQRPAQLFLRTSIGIRDKDTRGWRHFEKVRKLQSTPSGPPRKRYILRGDDVQLKIANLPNPAAAGGFQKKDNQADVDEAAAFYIQAELEALQWNNPGTVTYAGLRNIPPDGAIQQVSWIISQDGKAYTRVSRNRDEPDLGQTFLERRRVENLIEILDKAKPRDKPRDGAK